jgi:hypothetical protein
MVVTKKNEGTPIRFAGFDGKAYEAVVVKVHRGTCSLAYSLPLRGLAMAYLARKDWDRLSATV